MNDQVWRSWLRYMIGSAGAAMLVVGAGGWAYASESAVSPAVNAEPICGSIDPGFSRPLVSCLTQRLHDLLAPAVGTPLSSSHTPTPSSR